MTGTTRILPIDGPLDLRQTLAPMGKGRDPFKPLPDGGLWRTYHSPAGPATIRVERTETGVSARAWGPGAEHALETLPDLVGAHDDPRSFEPEHAALRDLHRRTPGIRFGRTDCAVESLIKAIPAQRVTAKAAGRSARELTIRYGQIAPGPSGMKLLPHPEKLAVLSYANLHSAGLERGRATTILEVCRRANRIERLREREPADAVTRLQSIRGVGPWSANRVADVAWGWSDAVEVGDYWLPSLVIWHLTGKPRGDDDEMLELLEPYRPHRGRVIKLLMTSGRKLPRFGPRLDVRDFRSE